MSDVLMRTNIDKLTLLPSGRPHPKSTELLASDAMRQLLNDMASRYPDRKLLWDGPQMRVTNDKDADAYVRRVYRKGFELGT